jgi:hypothetical protein
MVHLEDNKSIYNFIFLIVVLIYFTGCLQNSNTNKIIKFNNEIKSSILIKNELKIGRCLENLNFNGLKIREICILKYNKNNFDYAISYKIESNKFIEYYVYISNTNTMNYFVSYEQFQDGKKENYIINKNWFYSKTFKNLN